MIDLDTKIRSLVERNIPRKDIVSELDAIASDPESRAKRFERTEKTSSAPRRKATDIGRRARGQSAPESSARRLRAELEAQRAAHEHRSAGARLVSQAPKPVSGLWSVMAVV